MYPHHQEGGVTFQFAAYRRLIIRCSIRVHHVVCLLFKKPVWNRFTVFSLYSWKMSFIPSRLLYFSIRVRYTHTHTHTHTHNVLYEGLSKGAFSHSLNEWENMLLLSSRVRKLWNLKADGSTDTSNQKPIHLSTKASWKLRAESSVWLSVTSDMRGHVFPLRDNKTSAHQPCAKQEDIKANNV